MICQNDKHKWTEQENRCVFSKTCGCSFGHIRGNLQKAETVDIRGMGPVEKECHTSVAVVNQKGPQCYPGIVVTSKLGPRHLAERISVRIEHVKQSGSGRLPKRVEENAQEKKEAEVKALACSRESQWEAAWVAGPRSLSS